MDKIEIKRRIYQLRKERQLLETHCLSINSQLPVWLSLRFTKCWKEGCKCMRGKPHGPFAYISFKEKGRLCYRYFPVHKTSSLREYIANYRSFQTKIARLNKVHQEIVALLKESQKSNLLSIPQWLKKKKGQKKD